MTKEENRHLRNNTCYCSFCGKTQYEVDKLISGPTVFICDECVVMSMQIVVDYKGSKGYYKINESFDVDDDTAKMFRDDAAIKGLRKEFLTAVIDIDNGSIGSIPSSKLAKHLFEVASELSYFHVDAWSHVIKKYNLSPDNQYRYSYGEQKIHMTQEGKSND